VSIVQKPSDEPLGEVAESALLAEPRWNNQPIHQHTLAAHQPTDIADIDETLG